MKLPQARTMWAGLAVLALGSTVSAVLPRDSKTNRMYLAEIIDSGVLQQTAGKFASAAGRSPAEIDQVQRGLTACLQAHARAYLSADDPYLAARADKRSPGVLAERFLRACGVL